MSLSSYGLAFFVVIIWAFNGIAIKTGLEEIPPLLMTLMRFSVAALIMVPFFRINKSQIKLVLLLAFTFGFMHFALLFLGMKYAEVGISALLVQLGTPLAIIMASFIFKEKLRVKQIVGIIISVFGVACLAGSPAMPPLFAVILLLFSALGWALTNIIMKKSTTVISPMVLTGWVCLFSIPIVALTSFMFESHQVDALLNASWRGWFGILYSGIASSVIAHSIWSWLIKRNPINLILPISLLGPVISVMMGALLLGETLNINKIVGTFLVVGGIFVCIVNLKTLLIKRYRRKLRKLHDQLSKENEN